MKVKVQGSGGTLELADATFGAAFNEPLVHQVVTAYLAGGACRHEGAEEPLRRERQRQEAVEAEGHRPRARRLDPQPDLGRRRPHVRRAPAQLRAEGQPQDVPRRDALGVVRAAAPRARSIVTDELGVSAPKTKELKGKLDKLGFTHGSDRRRERSTRSSGSRRATCRTSTCSKRSSSIPVELGRRRQGRRVGRGDENHRGAPEMSTDGAS